MTERSDAPRPAIRRVRRGLLILAWSGLLILCFINIETPGDFDKFIAFGRAAADGAVAYAPLVEDAYYDPAAGHWATWPPGFTPLARVLAWGYGLAEAPTVILFQLLNLFMLATMLLVAVEWLTGKALRSPDPETRLSWDAPEVAAGLLVPLSLIWSNFEYVQVNLLAVGLVILGFRLLESRRWLGGFLFGIGSAIKATPILLLPYLAWRGRWRDLGAAAVGVFVGWLVLPALVLGPVGAGAWWKAWVQALPATSSMESWMNQSLKAVALRHFGPEIGTGIWIFGTLFLALLILVAFARPFRGVDSRRSAGEIALLLVATTVVSPVAWKAHYVTLAPLCAAVFVMARDLEPSRRRRFALIGLGIVAAGVNATAPDLIGRTAALFFQEKGLTLLMVLLLVGTGLALLGSADRVSSRR